MRVHKIDFLNIYIDLDHILSIDCPIIEMVDVPLVKFKMQFAFQDKPREFSKLLAKDEFVYDDGHEYLSSRYDIVCVADDGSLYTQMWSHREEDQSYPQVYNPRIHKALAVVNMQKEIDKIVTVWKGE